MAIAVTTDILRDLAGFRADNGCAVSIYIGFDPSETPTIPDVETKFNSLLADAEKLADGNGSSRDCRVSLRDDLERIRSWWDDEFERDGSRGVAIFASSADGVFRAVPLQEAPRDRVAIGHELYLAPLAGQLGRGDGALVVVVGRERGTIYRLRDGRLEEVADETEEAPGQHDQGGWAQARYQRHIEKLVKEHLKNVGDHVDRSVRRSGGLHLVIVGPEETRGDFESALSTEAREAIVGWTTAEAHAGPTELLQVVQPLLDAARAREEQSALERWQEEHGRGGRAAAGWKQVLDAASDARVEVLLLGEEARREAWRCPQCGRGSADGGKCKLDDAKLEQREDGADVAIHLTLLHGGTLVRLGAGALADADGIAALLRF